MSALLSERRLKDALAALATLENAGFAARLAGGCVRDRLMGIGPQDYDIATSARPAEVTSAFQAAGYKVAPTGVAHGTVTVVLANGPIEVTTLRTDVATHGRHATVAFGASFEADAARRDFTINAMFEDRHGHIYDSFAGRVDLAAKTLRFVGDARQRIAEDYLRILRLFRFWSRFGFEPAPGTLDAVTLEREGLAAISQERITNELLKTLAGSHAIIVLPAMMATGVWRQILPELSADSASLGSSFTAAWHELEGVPLESRALGRLFLLMQHLSPSQPSKASIQALGKRLRLSNLRCKCLASAEAWWQGLAGSVDDTAAALELVDLCESVGPGMFATFFVPLARAIIHLPHRWHPQVSQNIGTNLAFVEASELSFGYRRTARLPLDGLLLRQHLGAIPGPELGRLLAVAKHGFRNGAFADAEGGLRWLQAQARSYFE